MVVPGQPRGEVGEHPVATGKDVIVERLRRLGALSGRENVVGTVFAATVGAWVSRGLFWGSLVPSVDDATIAILASLALLAIPADGGEPALDWESAKKIPWGVLLLIGGGLALASGFVATGLDT
jgi:solute carrier family 13 (sodium-dependent dicarboxylate transporter), member 2/3/5